MRVVHPEDAHALLDPEAHDALQFLPERLPMRGFKVKGVDIFVRLGGIFGILHCAVRAPAKPLRMLLHVGMIGGALEGEVERDLDAILLGFGDQYPKVRQGPELRMYGRMSAGRRPNGPGAPWIVGSSHGGIVLPFAVHLPNGMNRRQVEYVKAHVRDIGQARCTVPEGPVLTWHWGAGAWEHFVPGAEASLVA